jgi:hypothetical protein
VVAETGGSIAGDEALDQLKDAPEKWQRHPAVMLS